VKHVKILGKRTPMYAAPWQDVVCQVNNWIYGALDAKGGSSPAVSFIYAKCNPLVEG
jgi:hypothetical protein